MAFPIVSAFGADTLGAFEALATIFTVVTPGWFELFPDPPVSVVCFVESVLANADPQLSNHLDSTLMGAFAASWALLSTFLAEVLYKDDWLTLWDHVLVGADSLLPLAAAAFLIYFRAPLLVRESGMRTRDSSRPCVLSVPCLAISCRPTAAQGTSKPSPI